MFKKYTAILMAIAAAASLTLAGCAKDDTDSSSTLAGGSEVVSNSDVSSETDSGAESEETSSDSSETSSEVSSDVSSETSSAVSSDASSETSSETSSATSSEQGTSSSESRPPMSAESSSAETSSEVSSEASSEETSSETSSSEEAAGMSCTSLYEATIAGLEMPMMMVIDPSLGDSTLTDSFYFDLDLADVSDYCVAVPMMMVHATEIAIFKPVDKAAAKNVKAAIEARLEILENNWSNYLPEQYELVQNHKIVEHNGYIMMVVSYFPDEMVEQFKLNA